MNRKGRPRMTMSVLGAVVLLLVLAYVITQFSGTEIQTIAQENKILGAILLSLLMFVTTVIAPLTSLLLVPMVSPFLGPFITGVSSFVGWMLGALVAFWIARYGGRPLLERVINMETIQKYESRISPETGFALIVALRMLIPVDLLSYALGLFTTVSFRVYTFATMLGILWFSFAFSYFGDALVRGDSVLLVGISVASGIVLVFSWWYARHVAKRDNTSS